MGQKLILQSELFANGEGFALCPKKFKTNSYLMCNCKLLFRYRGGGGGGGRPTPKGFFLHSFGLA